MTQPRHSPWHVPAVLVLLAITAVLVLSSGCTQQAQKTQDSIATIQTTAAPGTPVAATTVQEGKKMVTFTEKDNGTTADIAENTRFAVQLEENPTTGYSWNASTSSGLTILSSDYQENKHAGGMVGVGGIRTWVLQASGSGDQTFNAVYGRSWEPVTGNETAYTMNIRIVSS
ncbi:MAG: protease inhibitor I42 family protein [Methanoregula sp.]|uniref:protease inhibitor I42 family protein n=1 Tax=Methanoregula sp. TaxID=2052170 RepID=UPI0025D4E9D3|nr:protease inhibitor I42 family protein [Methanoregula sp.]MCK9632126.1 protease inhibitor I42 family protein [Methanoregula sp.]